MKVFTKVFCKVIPIMLIMTMLLTLASCGVTKRANVIKDKITTGNLVPKNQAVITWNEYKYHVSASRSFLYSADFAVALSSDNRVIIIQEFSDKNLYYDVSCISAEDFKQYVNSIYDAKSNLIYGVLQNVTWGKNEKSADGGVSMYCSAGSKQMRLYNIPEEENYALIEIDNNGAEKLVATIVASGEDDYSNVFNNISKTLDTKEDLQDILETVDSDVYNAFELNQLAALVSKTD